MRDGVDSWSLLSGMSSHATWRPGGHSTQPDVKSKRCVVGQAKMPTSLKTHAVSNSAGVFVNRKRTRFNSRSGVLPPLQTRFCKLAHVIYVKDLHLAVDLTAHGEE